MTINMVHYKLSNMCVMIVGCLAVRLELYGDQKCSVKTAFVGVGITSTDGGDLTQTYESDRDRALYYSAEGRLIVWSLC